MEKFKNLNLEQKIDILKEDYQNDWWKPSKIDDYDLKKKLLRVGCRPIRRKFEKCSNNSSLDYDYSSCAKIKRSLDECQEALYYFYYSSRKEEIFENNSITNERK